ncbi:MAG TPA: hypothetical protein VGX52_12455, partial [Burkholderiales bacterium]|nr:hypothetical protein [Burkholderiales bacterium]
MPQRALGALFGKDVDEPLDFGPLRELVPLAFKDGDDQVFGNLFTARELAQGVELGGVLPPGMIQHGYILRSALVPVLSESICRTVRRFLSGLSDLLRDLCVRALKAALRAYQIESAPMRSELCALTATELVDAFRKKTLSPVDVTRAVLERIEALNPVFNAFSLVSDQALDDAKASQAR